MYIDKSSCFNKEGRIMTQVSGEDVVLVDPYRRTRVLLNPVALKIWQLLDGHNSMGRIIEAIKEEFDAGDEELEKDVGVFLKCLIRREMIK